MKRIIMGEIKIWKETISGKTALLIDGATVNMGREG